MIQVYREMERVVKIKIVCYSDYQDAIICIRHEVFVIGQDVPEDLEIDGKDPECTHVLVWDDKQTPIATARMTEDGKIGRMAVLEKFRGQGIGGKMLDLLLDEAIRSGQKRVYLNSQCHATAFYGKAGFVNEGEIFMEAGIPHVRMVKVLPVGIPGES